MILLLSAIQSNVPVTLFEIHHLAPGICVFGLLFGSILTDKQVGGICGAILTNLSAWLSGTWFDLELVVGARICNLCTCTCSDIAFETNEKNSKIKHG